MEFMNFLRHFLGDDWGVHPDDRKRPAADQPVRVMPLPARLYLPLQQHLGSQARPAVLVGQKVKKGELIAEAQGMVSAPIHAPTSGTITAVTEVAAPHPSGLTMPAIILEADGADEWCELHGCDDPFALPAAEIGKRVAAAGVVGLGGAAFPSAVKLIGASRAKVTTLVMNGGECEPYLSCDDRLMRDAAAGIVDGIRIMLHATGARVALVGIEDNKPEAIAAMQAAAADFEAVQIRPVPARYPMGSEKQLIQALTGIEVPADGRPADIGVIVHNVGTALAVRTAVREGKPLISRLVTVNGNCASQPGNIEVRVGTLAEEVIAFAGGLKGDGIGLARRVMGGPMMGMQIPALAGAGGQGHQRHPGLRHRRGGRTGAEPVHPLRQLRQGLPDGPAAAGDEFAHPQRGLWRSDRPRAQGLYRLRLLRLCLPVEDSAGPVFCSCQGRTGGAGSRQIAHRRHQETCPAAPGTP